MAYSSMACVVLAYRLHAACHVQFVFGVVQLHLGLHTGNGRDRCAAVFAFVALGQAPCRAFLTLDNSPVLQLQQLVDADLHKLNGVH
jgi:hypothetical protein